MKRRTKDEKLADAIVNAMYDIGNEGSSKCWRMSFYLGTGFGDEYEAGGMGRRSMRIWLRDHMREIRKQVKGAK
jgi:hypothetical protein